MSKMSKMSTDESTSIRKKIELIFEKMTGLICTGRWALIVLMVILFLVSLKQLPNLKFDMSNEGFLHSDDPILISYNKFREQFGQDDLIVLGIEADDIFSQEFLTKLKKLHTELYETTPHLDDIFSLINARNTYGEGDTLIVGELLEVWPKNKQQLAQLKRRVLSNTQYIDRLISKDGSMTTIVLKTDAFLGGDEKNDLDSLMDGFDSDDDKNSEAVREYLPEAQRDKIVKVVSEIIAKYNSDNFKINMAGSPVIISTLKQTMRSDMMHFIRLALLLILIALFFMFKRVSAVIYPLIVVVLSLVSTLGLISFLGVPLKMPMMILPSFILAVGVGDSVHILAIFYRKLEEGLSKKEAIIKTLGHSGVAVFMTTVTTAAGLYSFANAKVAPISDLGLFAAIAVILALIYTLIFLPALLVVTPFKKVEKEQQIATQTVVKNKWVDDVLLWVADFSAKRYALIISVSFIFVLLIGAGAFRLNFSHNVLEWLPNNLPIYKATKKLDKVMNGTVTLEMIFDTGVENGIHDRGFLEKLDQLSVELTNHKQDFKIPVGKVMSVVDIIKEIHRALHENQNAYYKVPTNSKVIPQEFLLFENSGSDDLEDSVDSRFQIARVTVKVPWQDAMYYVPFIKQVKKRVSKIFGNKLKFSMTGMMSLFGRILYAAIHSAAQSYLIAILVISILMIVLIGSLKLGLISMIPNLTPIIVALGIMGWFGIPWDMFTMLIGSIAIGIAVDDTIHFMYNFQKYYLLNKDAAWAIKQTLLTTGRAMFTTTVVLSCGFFIFMFASMHNLFYFGMLTGITLIFALLADFFLAGALMVLVTKFDRSKK